jgi:colanic acid biosynthesis glycosyl transferase WcaI
VVSISHQMCALIEKKGVEKSRIALVRNWIDIEKVIEHNVDASDRRRQAGLSPDDFVVLYAGSIGAKQGLDVLLDAAASLQDRKKLVFIVAGDGPAKPALLEKYGRLANVRFLPPQPEASYCALLCAADLHVLPQMRGAGDLFLPSKLGAVLASGRPVIVAADGGTELFEFLEGAAGLVPPGDSRALARAIAEAVDAGSPSCADARLQCAEAFAAEKNLGAFAGVIFALARQREVRELAVAGVDRLNIARPAGDGGD